MNTATGSTALSGKNQDQLFDVSRKGYDQQQVDDHLAQLAVAAQETETRLHALEAELRDSIRDVAALERRVDSETQRAEALEREVEAARENEDAVRLMLQEASKTRTAMITESEEAARAVLREADAQAEEILQKAHDTRAAMEREAAEHQDALRAFADKRAADLDARLRLSEDRLRLMSSLYDELKSTLQLVATTSIDELIEAQKVLEPLELDDQDPRAIDVAGTPRSHAQSDEDPQDAVASGAVAPTSEDIVAPGHETDVPTATSGSAAQGALEQASPSDSAETDRPEPVPDVEWSDADGTERGTSGSPSTPGDHDAILAGPDPGTIEPAPSQPEDTTDDATRLAVEEAPTEPAPSVPEGTADEARTQLDDEDETHDSRLPHLGDVLVKEAHDMAKSLRKSFTS